MSFYSSNFCYRTGCYQPSENLARRLSLIWLFQSKQSGTFERNVKFSLNLCPYFFGYLFKPQIERWRFRPPKKSKCGEFFFEKKGILR